MKLGVILIFGFVIALAGNSIANEQLSEKKTTVALGGSDHKQGEKYHEYKHAKKSGKKSKHDEEKSKKGEKLKELHKIEDEEKGGKKKTHHSQNGYKKGSKSGGGSEHGAKFQEAAQYKKNNYKKGYRENYHKDEHKKHDRFYSNAHKSGTFEVFGKKHSKFNKFVAAKKQAENHKSAKDANNYKKTSVKVGGHNKADKKGHKEDKATKSQQNHHEKWAKHGGKKGGKQYKYNKISPK